MYLENVILSERSQSPEATDVTRTFTREVRNRQIPNEEAPSRRPGTGVKAALGAAASEHRASLRGDENVSRLDGGGGCTSRRTHDTPGCSLPEAGFYGT